MDHQKKFIKKKLIKLQAYSDTPETSMNDFFVSCFYKSFLSLHHITVQPTINAESINKIF